MTKRVIRMIALSVWVASLTAGCIDNAKSLTIVGAAVPTENCDFSVDPIAWYSAGLLDIAHPIYAEEPVYYMAIQLENFLLSNASPENLELDSMRILLEKAVVTYEWLYGKEEVLGVNAAYAPLLLLEEQELEIFIAGTVDSSDSGDPGKSMVAGLQVIPRQIGTQLSPLEEEADGLVLGIKIQVHGQTVGGLDIETNNFLFPVYLCYGCLNTLCDCAGVVEYPACFPGQDGNNRECECSAAGG